MYSPGELLLPIIVNVFPAPIFLAQKNFRPVCTGLAVSKARRFPLLEHVVHKRLARSRINLPISFNQNFKTKNGPKPVHLSRTRRTRHQNKTRESPQTWSNLLLFWKEKLR